MPHISQCPECDTYSPEKISYDDEKKIVEFVRCNHFLVLPFTGESVVEPFSFVDGRKPFGFQQRALEIIRKEGGSAIVNLKTGRGKTIVAGGALHLWPEQYLPCVIACKSGIKMQWAYEMAKLTGHIPQVIESSMDDLLPLDKFPIVIIGLDMLRRLEFLDDISDEVKSVIIDECQLVKNPSSARAKHVARLIGNDGKHVLSLSATPVKNNADEMYFVINQTAPWRFSSHKQFRHTYVAMDYSGSTAKWGGINKYIEPQWREATKDMIIRFTDEEMGLDLPPVLDTPLFTQATGESYRTEYEKALDKMDEIEAMSFDSGWEKKKAANDNIMRMKHLAGLMKVDGAVAKVEEFLEDNPESSLADNPEGRYFTVFVHHIDVGDEIEERLKEVCKEHGCNPPIRLLGGNFPGRDEMNKTAAEIYWPSRDPKDRILIASTLAAGEGWNLQKCAYGLLVERQWNDANESQPLGRFERIGSLASCINFMRMICIGTVDELLVEMRATKKQNTNEALSIDEDEDVVQAEVISMMLQKGRALWNRAQR